MPRFSTLTGSTMLRVAGVVAAIAVTTPFAMSASAVGIEPLRCGRRVDGPGMWQAMASPAFSQAEGLTVSQNISAYAVSPSNTQVVAVTNGNSVYVSQNGGCSWKIGLQLNRTSVPSGLTAKIKSLYISAANTVFAVAEDLDVGAGVTKPIILRSTNSGVSAWQQAGETQGLPPLGTPLLLRGHRTRGNVLYLSFSGAREQKVCPPAPLPCPEETDGDALGLLYASTDGGATWSSRTDASDLGSVTEIKHFSIDDDDTSGNTVWLVARGLLRKSTDGGRSYETPDGLDQSGFTFTTVESLANTRHSRGLKLVAFSVENEMIRLQRNQWIRSRVPFPTVESVAQRPEGDFTVATIPAAGNVSLWRIYPKDFIDYEQEVGLGGKTFKSTYGWEPVNPGVALPVSAMVNAGDAPLGEGTYYVRDNRRVLRFLGSAARNPNPPVGGVNLSAPPPPDGKITPIGKTYDIPVGKTLTVPYTLTLPPAPTPIDIFLLVDNSGSMSPIIQALKDDLGTVVQSLHDTDIDVNVGVGQINVQPERQSLPVDDPRTEDIDESKPKPIYQLLRKVGPIRGDLYAALSRMDGNGGSGKEPQLEALWQAVNGDGLDLAGLGFLLGYSIPPDHDADFREALDPIKVIVHATDEEFSTDIQGEAHNDFEEVAAALRTAGVKQIGLSQGNPDAAEDLGRMAALTGALAPPGGTDCDGDGRIGPDDVRGGEPLVCGQSFGLDETLVNLIRSLSDRQTITVAATGPTVQSISRTEFPIDAKQATLRTFSITYSCKGLQPGQYFNDLRASLRGITIEKGTETVNCGGLSARPLPQPPVEPAVNPPPPQPQPVVPAPVPVNPVPQPQTQVQTQVNPQAGMADQEEEQLQVAVAENNLLPRDDDQLAMTALSYADNPEVVLAFGMTLASAVGAGVALSRRRRTATATAKVTVR